MKLPNENETEKMVFWLKGYVLRLSQSTSAADQYRADCICDFLKRFDETGLTQKKICDRIQTVISETDSENNK